MNRTANYLILFFIVCFNNIYSQANTDSAEVFIVDAFVSEKSPYNFQLYFFTDDSVKSSILIDGKYKFNISEIYTTDHKIKIETSKLKFDSLSVPYQLLLTYPDGNIKSSEKFEFELPYNSKDFAIENSGIFKMCVGGIMFLLPSPGMVIENGNGNLSLALEVPIFSFYSKGFNYPSGYISTEYSHIFGDKSRDLFQLGYKQITGLHIFQFVSPGINYFTNFSDYNGISPELTIGIFKIANVFTFYVRYRYYLSFQDSKSNTNEISIGLFSHFFSLNL